MWKFHDFSITQFLREINFGEPISSKTTIFANFVALHVVDLEIFSLQKVQRFIKKSKFGASNSVKMADFALLKSLKLIKRKF